MRVDDERLAVSEAWPAADVRRRAIRQTTAAVVLANVIGAIVVLCYGLFALPEPHARHDSVDGIAVNAVIAVVDVVVSSVLGAVWGRRRVESGPQGASWWLIEERPPTAAERRLVLRAPGRLMAVQAALWGVAVVLFAVLNGVIYSVLFGLGVGAVVLLGGFTTAAASFLTCELALRPIAARALAHGASSREGVPGVAARWGLAWGLGTGVPVVGLMLLAVVALASGEIDETTLAIMALALGGVMLLFGAAISFLAAYATVQPISAIDRGLRRVREGDLDVELGVWDSTEMGLLQAGFNDMVRGLRERERIRGVFGRQVGEDVARLALADEIRLGGEVREVSVLFVDLVGSTQLAARLEPEAVVELLNRFFACVVAVVEESGGWINKFQGDAALAIFGAPLEVPNAPDRALRAARELDRRARDEVPELRAAIGAASGRAVAGNIGAQTRFEYTVIGDPVNEAARLTDLAKDTPARVLVSDALLAEAGEEERARWALGDAVTLRGRDRPTRLATPAEPVRPGPGRS